MREFRIFLPEATPSLNTRKREHWGKTKAWRKRWAELLLVEITQLGGRDALKATSRRRLTVERHGKKALDGDNLAGGAKELIDEVRTFGLLIDDSPKHAELIFKHVPLGRGLKPHTILILEDAA